MSSIIYMVTNDYTIVVPNKSIIATELFPWGESIRTNV